MENDLLPVVGFPYAVEECHSVEMKDLLNRPVFLLLGTGLFLGCLMPLGKLAGQAGFDPFLWATMIALVPGLCLATIAGRSACSLGDLSRFGFVSGLFAYVIPNAVLFTAMPHIGSGLAGLMFALSPVATAVISLAFGVRPPSKGLLIAVGFGFVGAILIVAGRQTLALSSAANWLLAALAIPLSLAIGNVYRSARWPVGATPTQVGAASNLLAAPLLFVASHFQGGTLDFALFANHLLLVIAQCVASLLMFLLFFRLQVIGGPTYLSQIGYIAAAVGLLAGVGLLGESYPMIVWAGAALIIAGILANFVDRPRKSSA